MKRTTLLGLVVLLCFLLCSCQVVAPVVQKVLDYTVNEHDWFDLPNSQKTVIRTTEQVMQAVDEENVTQLVSLFSSNLAREDPDLVRSAEELIRMIEGSTTSVEYVYDVRSFKKNVKSTTQMIEEIRGQSRVETTEDVYEFALKVVTVDTVDPNNVGIVSLSCIRQADDPYYPKYSYAGDNLYKPGIHLNALYPQGEELQYNNWFAQKELDKLMSKLMQALEREDASQVVDLFAPNQRAKIPDLKRSAEELTRVVHGYTVSIDQRRNVFAYVYDDDHHMTGQDMWGSFLVETTEDTYLVALMFDHSDIGSEYYGLESLSVLRLEDDPTPEKIYWGTGQFEPGIHLNVQRPPEGTGFIDD